MKKLFFKLTQRYGDLKLQSKMTLLLLVIVTVPLLVLGVFFYSRLYDMVVSYTIRQEQDASATTAPLIEDMLQEVLDTCQEVTDAAFYRTLFSTPIQDTPEDLLNSKEAADYSRHLRSLVDGKLITNIRFYAEPINDSPEFSFSDIETDFFASAKEINGTYWHGIFHGTNASDLFCPSFYLGSQEQKNNGDMAYIKTATLRSQEHSYRCYVAIYFSAEPFNEILSDNITLDGGVSYIINERNSLAASSSTTLSGIYWLDYDTIQSSFMSSNNFIERMILEEKVYVGFYSIKQPNWFMVTVLPSKPLIQQSNNLMFQYILFYLLFLLVASLFAFSLTHSITNRISSVISQMRLVRQGPPVPMESPKYHDEIGDLIDTYNYMTRKMNQLIEEQGKAAEDLRIAEFNSLQAQINPHFLYNTMDMINWLAQQGRTSEVSSAVQNLSKFYKLTLSRKKSISTIAKEEEHVSIYIQLQNMRYHDNIEFVSDIPDELMSYQIPKLTLQPVIENAILHGILEKDSKSGTIVLTGWREENDIVLLISDDGVGISPEKLPHILSGNGSSSSGGTNIAVYNTHRRLQILYGINYGLSYSSIPDQGTEVHIRIPAQKEYQNPYIHATDTNTTRALFPLATVSTRKEVPVSPEIMLEYSQKLTRDLYNIQNLHQIFEELPEKENIYILTHEVTANFPNHTHDYFELNYVCRGSLINIVDGNEIYMTAGDLVFLGRDAVHALQYQQPDTILINFCLWPELFQRTLKAFCEKDNLISSFFLRKNPKEKNYIFFSLGHSLHAQSILTSLIQEYAASSFHQSFSLEAYFLLLFTYLVSAEEFSYFGIDGQTHHMVQYLREHCLNEEPETIAAHFHYRVAQLDEHLKKRTGRNLNSFVNETRLQKAVELMSNPNLNIYQIVEECGYQDTEEFNRIFQKKFHVSPTEYRKQFL